MLWNNRGRRLNVRLITPVRKWRPPALRYSQPHCVQLFNIEFHLNRTMSFKSMDRNSITPPNTASLSLHRHSWNKHSTGFYSHILYQILSKSDENAENEGKIYLKPVSKAWISLHPFTRTTSMSKGITRSSVPNATQTRQQMWKVWVHIHLHTDVEYECQWAYFHKTAHALQLYRYVRIVAKSSY
jgi:hypothetical protein